MGILTKLVLVTVGVIILWFAIKRFLFPKPPKPVAPAQPKPIADMRQCRVCATYMAADAPRCGRADCPVGVA